MGFSQPQAFARVFSSLLSKNGFSFPLKVSQITLDAMCDMFSPQTTLLIREWNRFEQTLYTTPKILNFASLRVVLTCAKASGSERFLKQMATGFPS